MATNSNRFNSGRSKWNGNRGHQQRGPNQRGQFFGNRNNRRPRKPQDVDLNNPIIQAFQGYAKELDAKNDRYERLVKLSRDITVESKRAIFALHRITSDDEKARVLWDVEKSLIEIQTGLWYAVARELRGQQQWRFVRAYYAGLQEYVEALSFFHFHSQNKLITLKEVEEKLTFQYRVWHDKLRDPANEEKEEKEDEDKNLDKGNEADEKKNDKEADKSKVNMQDKENEKKSTHPEAPPKDESVEIEKQPEQEYHYEKISVLVPPFDFIMGLADLTGEIMRMAINLVGLGDLSSCFRLSSFLHALHVSLEGIDANRGLSKKQAVLKQSLAKVEYTCYTINVRGSELNKNSIAEFLIKEDNENMDEKLGLDEEAGSSMVA